MKDYLKHWKVESSVFLKQGIRAEDLYLSEPLRLILSRLGVFFDQVGANGLLYGTAGCGKTSLVNYLSQTLDPRKFELMSLFVGARYTPGSDWLTPQLLDYFGLEAPVGRKKNLSNLLSQVSDVAEDGRRLLILVDGIEHFKKPSDFEPILTFHNWELLSKPCVNFLLLGRNEVLPLLKTTDLYQNFFLEIEWPDLGSTDIEQYIQKVLQSKGMPSSVFSLNAVQELARQSQSSMKRLQNILEQSLVLGAELGVKKIDADLIKQATLSSLPSNGGLLNMRDSVS